MVRRTALTIIACTAAALAAADAPAPSPESPRTRAAHYYAAGLERPLMQLRRGALLSQACTTRLRSACTKEQRAFAAKNHTLALLDELTLFPQRPAEDPLAGVRRAADLRDEMAATSAALLAEANAYDRQLLVRYGAALRT